MFALLKKYSFSIMVTFGFVYLLFGLTKSINHLFHFFLFSPRVAIDYEPLSTWLWRSITFYSPDHINAVSALCLVGIGYLTWFSSTHSFFWGKPLSNQSFLFKKLIKIEEPANQELASERIHKLARWMIVLTFILVILLQYSIWAALPVRDEVIPYILDKLRSVEESGLAETNPGLMGVANHGILAWLLLLLCMIPAILILFFIKRRWDEHATKDDLRKVFYTWKWSNRYISFLSGVQKDPMNIDVVIGVDTETKELVVLNGTDRNLNCAIGGSIGTGKTSATMIPILNQDMDHMSNLINHIDWEMLMENREEDQSTIEEELEKMSKGINGMVIVEPSNDLCQKLFNIAKAHKIPDEAIYYINPIDPNSMSINALRGPIEKVVESFIMMIQGLAKNQDEFFKQAQRAHLKHHLYLLKLYKRNDALLDDLIDMYHDPRLVWETMEKVERSIPQNWQAIQNRDERNHWYIVKGIVSWFRERGLLPVTNRDGLPLLYPIGHKHGGKQMIMDKQAQFVEGLRNILDDIAANMLIRRVLFGNSDFDIDTHLRAGGILLINTAMSELSDLHNTFGQLMISMVQNGIFRRGIWTSSDGSRYTDLEKESYHHVLIDETPEYVYEQFRRLPANSRKHKAIITVAFQSLSQMSIDFGDDFMYTFMSTFRHKMVYADVDKKTATVFSDYFGEDDRFKEDAAEQYVPSTMEAPGRRDSYTVKKEKELRMTPSEIMNLGAYEAAVRLVEKNSVQAVRVVKAVFVRMKYFKKAKVRVKKIKGQQWLKYRSKMMLEFESTPLKDTSILQEGRENPKDAFPKEELIQEIKKVYRGTEEKTVIGQAETMIIESDMSVEEMLGLTSNHQLSDEEGKNQDRRPPDAETEGTVESGRSSPENKEEAVKVEDSAVAEKTIQETNVDPYELFGINGIEENTINDHEVEIVEVTDNESSTPQESERNMKMSLTLGPEDIIIEDVEINGQQKPLSEEELVKYLSENKRIKL